MAEDRKLRIRIITPERVFYEGEARMAEFNTSEGELGIYPGHIPLTVILKPGVLTLTEPEGKKEAALHTGFAEILPDSITILAGRDRHRPGTGGKTTGGGQDPGA